VIEAGAVREAQVGRRPSNLVMRANEAYNCMQMDLCMHAKRRNCACMQRELLMLHAKWAAACKESC
jgi:hypothetical protein